MKADEASTPPVCLARLAGVLYLLIIVCGISSEAFIRGNLIETGDASATVANILASEGLFRLGFVADTIMLLSDVAIAVVFYILLKPVSKNLALTAAAFRLIQAAVLGINLLNYYAVMLLLNNESYSSSMDGDQLHMLAMLFLDLHSHGYDLGLLFFGISSLVLGYLVIKASYFPALLGYGLLAAAVVYLVGSYIRFLVPEYSAAFTNVYIIPLIAELAFCLWLLVVGVKKT